jgi:hypothetical protein
MKGKDNMGNKTGKYIVQGENRERSRGGAEWKEEKEAGKKRERLRRRGRDGRTI